MLRLHRAVFIHIPTARAVIVKEFTGVSDPYDTPEDAKAAIDALKLSAAEAANEIYIRLEKEGYIGPEI